MCLYIENIQPKIAKRDIICYKLVEKSVFDRYRSFYQFSPIELGKMYTSELRINPYANHINVIEEGLHSFCSKKAAMTALREVTVSYCYTGEIIKCIIPKGSTYYRGFNVPQYASNKIQYTTEIIHKF